MHPPGGLGVASSNLAAPTIKTGYFVVSRGRLSVPKKMLTGKTTWVVYSFTEALGPGPVLCVASIGKMNLKTVPFLPSDDAVS